MRPVHPVDLDRWIELRCDLWPEADPGELAAEAESFLLEGAGGGLLDARPHGVFVAEPAEFAHPGAPLLGFCEVSELPRPPAPGTDSAVSGAKSGRGAETQTSGGSSPVGMLEAWLVQPAARHAGVGRRLLDAAESWCRNRGLGVMWSDHEPGNDAGRAAHLACGFDATPLPLHLAKTLTG